MTYAKETNVSPEKTMMDIQATLKRYKAEKFGFMTGDGHIMVAFVAQKRNVKFILPLPKRSDFKRSYRDRSDNAAEKRYDQAVRSKWRALLLTIKAKLESVESGIETFDEAFASQLVLPDGQTVGEYVLPLVEKAYATGEMPNLQLALPSGKG